MFPAEEGLTEEELACWLAFDQLTGTGVGPIRIKLLYDRLGSMQTAWAASKEVLQRIPGFNEQTMDKFMAKRQEIDPEAILEQLRKTAITAIPYADPRYPSRLREIHEPPMVLYVNGSLADVNLNWTVGVVGTRNPTNYGQRLAKEISLGLSQNGVTVVSGMALGIDSLAHWGAIEGGSKTIAVLACGPDHCYPSSNKRLFRTLLEEEKGCVISEYFPGLKPDTFRFPARNRIISGLSHAVVVVEGALDSGSLITARLAFEQNREVFAVPGRVDSPMSQGPNELICRNVAHLVRDHEDVLQALNWVTGRQGRDAATVVELYGREKDVYELLSGEPIHFDVLCERTAMQAGEMSATLTMLELAGVVVRMSGDWYSLSKPGYANRQEPSLPG